MLTRITVHNSRYIATTGLASIELHVRHLQGEHYEVWKGSPWHWVHLPEPRLKLTRKRRRVLNREHRRLRRAWEEDTR